MNKWVRTLLIAIVVFATFSLYLFLRRGYYNVYIINKVFGSAAVVIAGITLLIGPLSRRYGVGKSLLLIRRHLGLTACALGLAHAGASIFLLPAKFSLAWFQREWMPVAFGAAAILLWLYLVKISNDESIRKLGFSWIRQQQLLGKLAFIFIFLHLVILKWGGWIKWLNGQVKATPELANPSYPPASIFVFLIMVGIIVYRSILALTGKKK